MLRLRKIPVAKNSMDNKAGIKILHRNLKFLAYKAEKFRSRTLSVSLFSRIGNFYASKGCHDFLSKFFCLTVPKKSVQQPFCAVFHNISGDEKEYG